MNAALPSSTSLSSPLINSLRKGGEGIFCEIPYPDEIGGEITKDVWNDLKRKSKWGVVNRINGKIRECGQDLIWKSVMRNLLEELAENER